MIPTERDRLELRHLIDNAELKRRLHLADAVIEAARDVFRTGLDMGNSWECKIESADALRAALDALDAGLEG
jgi:hypothetical protein